MVSLLPWLKFTVSANARLAFALITEMERLIFGLECAPLSGPPDDNGAILAMSSTALHLEFWLTSWAITWMGSMERQAAICLTSGDRSTRSHSPDIAQMTMNGSLRFLGYS